MNRDKCIGNAQTIGCCMNQSNYFMTSWMKDGLLAVLSDGKSDSVNGMRAAVICCEVTSKKFLEGNSLEQCHLYCGKVLREKIYLGRMPHVSLLTLFLKGEQAQFYQTGDTALYLHRKTGLTKIIERSGNLLLDESSSCLLCTEGVYRSVNEADLCLEIENSGTNQEKAEKILTRVQQACRVNQENATLLLLGQAI